MKHHIMDHSGHSTIEFDRAGVSDAMARFEKLLAGGYTAAVRAEGQRDYRVVKAFEPADETLFVPQLKGG